MSDLSRCNQPEQISLSAADRKVLQEMATTLKAQLCRLESFGDSFDSARQVVLRVSGASVSPGPRVALEVYGSIKAGGAVAHGEIACYRDPPGVCEPGPCDYLSD